MPPLTPGPRLSLRDCLVLVAAAGLYLLLRHLLPDFAWLLPFVVAHFFLFCNILRPGTKLELLWTGWFVAQVAGWAIWKGIPTFLPVLAAQAPVTLAVALITLRSPDYHGVFWRQVNPNWKAKP